MIGPVEWKFASLQVGVGAALALGAWVVQRTMAPLPDSQSAFEILFNPAFWSGFAVFAATYLVIAAAIGWIVGVGVAVAVLVAFESARRRSRGVLLTIPATCAALGIVGALVSA